MTYQIISERLFNNHKAFVDYIALLEDREFVTSNNGKWSPGQQLEHICLSVKPLAKILGWPKFIIKIVFGKANRPSKSYNEFIKSYLSRVDPGVKAPLRFSPNLMLPTKKENRLNLLETLVKKMDSKLSKFSEEDLDLIILPHPAMGKVTLREMLYFTILHVDQHHQFTIRDLKSKHSLKIETKSNATIQ